MRLLNLSVPELSQKTSASLRFIASTIVGVIAAKTVQRQKDARSVPKAENVRQNKISFKTVCDLT